ncbi:MAG: 3-phosphoserine/phosphohydroxythreonine transaminase, partial [Clostridia bacterium]|nr:3-phosphoserine/phosphohydroxythreonine transaminase [Clostridia bacterium]
YIPDTGDVPLIADISSCFLSEPLDVTKFAVVYGGAQKNIAPAGLTVVIVREDMLGNAMDITPTMFNYKIHADNDSLYNTPPCFTIYMCKLVLEWIKDMGGLEAVKANNIKKADLLYNFFEESKMFKSVIPAEDRSLMNIPFVTGNEELDAKFVKESTAAGFINLKGHRTTGGMRASVYNAMPLEGVEKLVEFMKKFEAENA